jgi:hypothetical protein
MAGRNNKNPAPRCTGTLNDGSPCRTFATAEGLCVYHLRRPDESLSQDHAQAAMDAVDAVEADWKGSAPLSDDDASTRPIEAQTRVADVLRIETCAAPGIDGDRRRGFGDRRRAPGTGRCTRPGCTTTGKPAQEAGFRCDGATRTRTGDLLGAIQLLFRARNGLFAAGFRRVPGVSQHLPQHFCTRLADRPMLAPTMPEPR